MRHTKAAVEKARNNKLTAREMQKKMAAGLEEAYGDHHHHKINKVKWIRCVGAIEWGRDPVGVASRNRVLGGITAALGDVSEEQNLYHCHDGQTRISHERRKQLLRGS